MSSKLSDRIQSYQAATDYKLLNRVPIIIVVNGRSFSKATQLLDKPYCAKFSECALSTMLKLCSSIEGAFFAYQFNDEIVVAARNDQNDSTSAWFNNSIQKICSATSSIATSHFNQKADVLGLNMTNEESIFTSQVFVVPNIAEAINTFIYKQQQNFHMSVQSACFYNLLNDHDKHAIKEMLAGLTIDGKIDLLSQECNVKFGDYPIVFRRGAAAYKVPKIVDEVVKNKWYLNAELPIFTKDQDFLMNIFAMGTDIYRAK
jgi:tRNA(His) 5'-end guanylyltransferase